MVRLQSSSFNSSSSPCLSCGNYSLRLFPKTIEGVLTAKSITELLGSGAWALRYSLSWLDWLAPNQSVSNLQNLLQAAAGSLEEKMLPLLLYWHSLRVKIFLMVCKFQAGSTDFFFFIGNENSNLQLKRWMVAFSNQLYFAIFLQRTVT